MINSKLNVNKAFIEQVNKCMNNIFGKITQPHIRTRLAKNNTRVLALLLFYETRKNPKKAFRVLSSVISTIIINYFCIDYLACESKQLSKLTVNNGGGFKHGNKSYEKILGIGIPYLLMNSMSCHGFLSFKIIFVILKCPKRMLGYYFSKLFTLLYFNTNNLEKLPNEIKDIIHADDAENSDKVVIFNTTIPSASNTLKNLAVNKRFHSSYIKT